MTPKPDHRDPNEQDRRRQGRRSLNPGSRPHDEAPFTAAFPLPLYADPSWIASNLPDLQRQITGYLCRRGLAAEPAVEAFHEAVVQLYKRPRPLHSRRAVSRWLSRASWHAAQRAEKRARQWARHHLLTPAPDAIAREDGAEIETEWETVARLRAAMQEVAGMRPSHRDALLRALQAELAAMGAADEAEALGATLPARPGEAETSREQARKLLARAQQRLRARLREWLAGIPLTRWMVRHHDVPLEVRAFVFTATLVGMASAATVLPSATATRVETVTTGVITPNHNGGILPVQIEERGIAAPEAAVHRVLVAAGYVSSTTTTSTTTTTVEFSTSPLSPNRTTVQGENRKPGNTSLLCARHVPLVDQECVPHPLRTGPETVPASLPER